MTEMFGVPQAATPGSTGSISTSESTTSDGSNGQSTTDTAKEQARNVAQEGVAGGKHVASVAADQVKEVAGQAGSQAQALLAEAKSDLMEQATSQKDRVAEQLHTLAHELGSMASSSEQDGLASDLAQQASRQVGAIAHWVSEREPGSMVGELKDFARAKPGMFLAVAAGIGLAAGRMTRGVKAGVLEADSSSTPAVGQSVPAPAAPVGLTAPGPVPSTTGGYVEPLAAGSPVGVGALYPDMVSEEPLAPRNTGLAP